MKQNIRQRFLSKVRQSSAQQCWLWQGSYPTGSEYGQTYYRGRVDKAHRVSYMIFNGSIPMGYDVRHTCDNPGCVNPMHLTTGTRRQNMQDAVKKKRHPHGVTHGRAKVNESQVRQIRALYRQGMSYRTLATRYGLSHLAIRDIVLRKTWGHVS